MTASRPPADAPIPTIGNGSRAGSGVASAARALRGDDGVGFRRDVRRFRCSPLLPGSVSFMGRLFMGVTLYLCARRRQDEGRSFWGDGGNEDGEGGAPVDDVGLLLRPSQVMIRWLRRRHSYTFLG